MKMYKVRIFAGNIYEVIEITVDGWDSTEVKVFQGTLPECDAWINLTEGGYL